MKYFFIILLTFLFKKNTSCQLVIGVDSSLHGQFSNLCITDFNGDGFKDVAGANYTGDLAMYEYYGDSSENLPFIFNSINTISKLRSADMDNDGDMDFVISGLYDKYIRWIENVDGGTSFYELSIGSWVGTGPKSLVVSDINNDGSMDIISNMGTTNLLIYKNSGATDPTFTEELIDIGASDPILINVTDIENDGDQDILYYDDTNNKIILRVNSGDGDFTMAGIPLLIATYVTALKFDDFDLDNDQDMLVGYDNFVSAEIELYENIAGVFTLKTSWAIPHDISGLTTAHFNTDSLPDILAVYNNFTLSNDAISFNESAVFINDGNLLFEPSLTPLDGVISSPYNDGILSLAISDMDLNGTDDIVFADEYLLLTAYSSDTSDVLFSSYHEAFKPRAPTQSLFTITNADSSGIVPIIIDDKLDIYSYNISGDIAVYKQAIESTGINFDNGNRAYSTIVFDMDNDGFKDDLFTSGGQMYEGSEGEFQWQVYRNLTKPLVQKYAIKTSYSCRNVFAQDINGDGYQDIVGSNGQLFFTGYDYEGFEIYEEFDAYFWLKNISGTGVFTYEALPGDYFLDEGYPIATDVDLDGDPDILVYNQTDDNVYCYYNVDGLGEFFPRSPILNIYNGQYLHPFDVDGDGIEDLVINTSGDLIKYIQHLGPNEYAAPQTICYNAKVRKPERLTFEDVNSDGFKDLLTGNETTQIYLNMDGFGFYPYPYVLPFNYVNRKITDINQNGIIEIAGIYSTNYAYAQELGEIPVYPINYFTNTDKVLDEAQLLSDTVFIKLSAIPDDTLIMTVTVISVSGLESEVMLNDGVTDIIEIFLLPDSSALDYQYFVIHAIDDPEVDAIENGRISYTLNNHEHTYPLANSIIQDYTIIDNDYPVADNINNIILTCNDTLITEGEFGTACSIKLNTTVDYPVNFILITDNQLDAGAGSDDSIHFQLQSTLTSKTFYIDAVYDTLTEPLHTGNLLIKTTSDDDNYDAIDDIIQSFSITDKVTDTTGNNLIEENQEITVWYIPETGIINLNYSLLEKDAAAILFNTFGEQVQAISLTSSEGEVQFSVQNLPEGFYFVMVYSINNSFQFGRTVVVY